VRACSTSLGSACAAFCALALFACNGGKNKPTAPKVGAGSPEFPTHFDPLAPLPPPAPPVPDKLGLEYLQAVHGQIKEPWHNFLENCRLRLPPEHVLNRMTLAVIVHLSIDSGGGLQGAALEQESGEAEFDEAALELIRETAPFPPPPPQYRSDDDNVHMTWLLARDRRQAGMATATINRFKWPAARAVPKFLSKGDVGTAALRLLEEMESSERPPADEAVELGLRIAEAAIREALRSDDPAVQLLAARTVEAVRMTSAAEALRAIVDTSVDMSVRAQAVTAIGAIGDRGAVQTLLAVLRTAKGSGVGGKLDVSIAAAKALAALGSADITESTVLQWLHASDDESLWAALVVLSEFPAAAALPTLTQLAGDTQKPREIRMAACTALGANATQSTAADAFKALRARFDDADAAVRAACTRAIARVAKNRNKSRFTYWQLIERIKGERDERVRAAAVRAAAALEPAIFHEELYMLRKESSALVLTALAEALARVPDPMAYKKLVSLLAHQSPLVRRRAAASLLEHPDTRARAVVAARIDDPDASVRMTAIRALTDSSRLSALLDDESMTVRQAALVSLVRAQGKKATLVRMLHAMVENPAKGMMRARHAAAWLAPALE
jgi:TonB family protein